MSFSPFAFRDDSGKIVASRIYGTVISTSNSFVTLKTIAVPANGWIGIKGYLFGAKQGSATNYFGEIIASGNATSSVAAVNGAGTGLSANARENLNPNAGVQCIASGSNLLVQVHSGNTSNVKWNAVFDVITRSSY